jgi:hypothetical protein
VLAGRRRLTIAVLALGLALAGCGGSSSSSSSKVSAAAYVKSVCSVIGPYEKSVQNRSNQLNLASIKSAAQGKTALQSFLDEVASDTSHAVTQLKAAGVPDVSNGKAIATGIVDAFTQVKTALTSAASRAGSLPTASPQEFKTAASALGSGVQSSMNTIGSSLGSLKSPTLEAAAAKEPACKSLASS